MNEPASNSEFRKDLVNCDFYDQAQETWNVNDLIVDLEKIKKQNSPTREGLTQFHKQYLFMALVGKELKDMIDQIEDITSVESLRTKLSIDKKNKGIHFCLEKLLKQKIGNPQNIIYHLFNSKYRRKPQPPEPEKETGLLIKIPNELSTEQLLEIEKKIRVITGCAYIRIVKIKIGSVTLFFKGSQSACEQIESLHKQGLLADLLGVSIERIEIIPNKVDLTKWFENIFAVGWERVEELLTPQQLSPTVWSDRTKRAKLFNLRVDLISHVVILVINLTRESENQVRVWLQVYPSGGDNYLPENLKLIVLAEGEVFEEVTARSADVLMQCQFDAEPGDEFSIKLALGEASVTEDFVV